MANSKVNPEKLQASNTSDEIFYNSLDEWKAAFFPKAYAKSLAEISANAPKAIGAAVVEGVCRKISMSPQYPAKATKTLTLRCSH